MDKLAVDRNRVSLSSNFFLSSALPDAGDFSDREKGRYIMIKDLDDHPLGLYDKPLPCFGCGI
ncbi:hypothetical protein C5167_023895 [Papaver somniferum]|uniref:Uncharacterized protein n=1 Tax=Papaver somniferum TaxID=3469 RepID=A0A4Y7JQX3_PAPSO|nr:hypothetical protein C5167_023895 [Papaver somniferum]